MADMKKNEADYKNDIEINEMSTEILLLMWKHREDNHDEEMLKEIEEELKKRGLFSQSEYLS